MLGLSPDSIQLLQGEYGWIGIVVVILYQLYAPQLLNKETALAPLVRDMPEKVDKINEEQEQIRTNVTDVQDHVEEVQDRQKIQMQVQRAQARATEQMDEDRVDEYLLQNGVEPEQFLRGDKMMEYSNWEDEDESESTANQDNRDGGNT